MRFVSIPRDDIDTLTSEFGVRGMVSIPEFLSVAMAQRLSDELGSAADWLEIFRAGEQVYEMPHSTYLALNGAQRTILRNKVEDAARDGLQYRYRAIRVSDDAAVRVRRGRVLDKFAEFMNSPEILGFFRKLVDRPDVRFVDAQATDFRAGDFLTTHDDGVEGKDRVAAYVYSLTTRWQPDWGGLLVMEDGNEFSGFVPDFNSLRIFSVPCAHHVSYVAPWVDERRISVTGWLRTQIP
ncbi:hypothetical protein EB810_12360 [Altererythrobacter sp. FM1]|nr:hypothetical protein EB810_12360 [Altererythrobacter sp. FM1]